MAVSIADKRGLKRICMSCGNRFYDMNKRPVVCPGCQTEFSGEAKVKVRRGRAAAAVADDEELPVRSNIAAANDDEDNVEVVESDEDTVSLDDVDEDDMDDNDDEDIDADMDLDDEIDDDLGDDDEDDEDEDEEEDEEDDE